MLEGFRGVIGSLSIENMRWMVLMHTRAVVSSVLLLRCWTMNSSPNL